MIEATMYVNTPGHIKITLHTVYWPIQVVLSLWGWIISCCVYCKNR
jgi:hypothetical protein